MRRWNGWGEETVRDTIPGRAELFLERLVGTGTPPRDVSLAEAVAGVPPSRLAGRLAGHGSISIDPEQRLRHARGQSFPDWVALRTGRIGAYPDAVAWPSTDAEVRALVDAAVASGTQLIPWGGGTSVVGGVDTIPGAGPTLVVDLSTLSGLRGWDEQSGLATFGAGVAGPDLEAQLRARGFTLGHYPQSFEQSTLGGWVATRSSGQQSLGFGRIEQLFAGGRVQAPAGTLVMPPHPASAAGPDLRQLVLGSEGRLGILTEATVRAVPQNSVRAIRLAPARLGGARRQRLLDLPRRGVPATLGHRRRATRCHRRRRAHDPARDRRQRRRSGTSAAARDHLARPAADDGPGPSRRGDGLAFRLLGVRETVAAFQADAEANWIHVNQPEIWAATHKLLLLSGFLTHRLTGRFVDSTACQVGYIPFDYKRLAWAGKGDWRWAIMPAEPRHLPDLVPPGGPLGEVSPSALEATGIPVGLPVVAAAADKACEVLGAGCVEPHVGCLSYGTTATINTTQRRYVEAIPLVPPYPAAVPGAWSLEVQVYRGYWMVSWFRREFGLREEQLAAARGMEPETLFDELVGSVPPGSMGLTLQPYWSPGVRIPGPEAKGAIIGFGDVHTRAHVYRAILEGLAYALREGAERSSKRAGTPITELRVSGGGSQSEAALQLTADVFGLPTARPHTYETSGLGAAIDAAVGLGLHSSFDAAVREMTRIGTAREPDPATHPVYDSLYERVHRRMYGRLQPLYEEIRRITGYPPA